jgi:hypothetical protein
VAEKGIGPLWKQFARINFYIFSFLVIASGVIALLASGKVAVVAANSCLVFSILLTLGCTIRVFVKLNKTLLKR